MNKAKKETKYIVIKIEDLRLYYKQFRSEDPSDEQIKFMESLPLKTVLNEIANMRESQGKPRENKYIVCNLDEPYANDVWDIILDGENEKISLAKEDKRDLDAK